MTDVKTAQSRNEIASVICDFAMGIGGNAP
jgi:hypothetical protein